MLRPRPKHVIPDLGAITGLTPNLAETENSWTSKRQREQVFEREREKAAQAEWEQQLEDWEAADDASESRPAALTSCDQAAASSSAGAANGKPRRKQSVVYDLYKADGDDANGGPSALARAEPESTPAAEPVEAPTEKQQPRRRMSAVYNFYPEVADDAAR